VTAALRRAGLRADRAFDSRSMKSQLKSADRSGARVVVIVGPDEVAAGTVSLRPLRRPGDQQTVPVADIAGAVRDTR
jgi:histidyl-tRNA synthetase